MATVKRVDAPTSARSSSEILDRQPPCSIESERAVLGSILLLPETADNVATLLRPEDFYDDANQRIYAHLREMRDSNSTIDMTLLVERLKSAGQYELVGGAAYLAEVVQSVPHAGHAEHYARIVRHKATQRALIHSSTEILRDAYDACDDPGELLGRAEERIFSILERQGATEVAGIYDILQDALSRLDARMSGKHTIGGIETDFAELDAMTGGLHNSELIILAARPGMGKTALALNITEHVAFKCKIPTLFVSLEMAAMELADRMVCSMAKVNGLKLRNGMVSKEDLLKFNEKAAELSQAPLFVDDAASRTMTEISANARRLKRKHNLGLIVIDYLQLIEPDNPRDPRQEQVARVARRLKGLAREMKVPVLCLAQLNRQTEATRDNTPRLSQLRESGAIEQDADVVMFIHREDYYRSEDDEPSGPPETPLAEIIVAKQRNGPTGSSKVLWVSKYTRFVNCAERTYDEFEQFA